MSYRFSSRVNSRFASNLETPGFLLSSRVCKLAFCALSAVLLITFVFAGAPAPVAAQAVNATLLGTVSDSSGAAVANAKVTITETNTNISRTTQTNESGNYVFPDLPPGTYRVIAELTGFKRASRSGVDVVVNTTSRIDLDLQAGDISETITVEAETPILQTERADTGRKLETVLVENMPLGTNRNFQNLLNLVPAPLALPSSTRNSSTPAARCRPKSTASSAKATTIKSKELTTTSALDYCKSSSRPSKPSRPSTSRPATSTRNSVAPAAPSPTSS